MTWNNLKTPLKLLVVIAIVALSLWAALPVQQKIKLGLDLRGGARLLLQLEPTGDLKQITPDVQAQTRMVIDSRINALGLTEPQITNVGTNRIMVEFPGNQRQEQEAEQLIRTAAVLDYKIVPPDVNQRAEAAKAIVANPSQGLPKQQLQQARAYLDHGAYDASGAIVYTGKEIKHAQASYDQSNQPNVIFNPRDPAKFGAVTSHNMGKLLGIFLDKKYVEAATIEGVITDNGEIHGSFTQEETTLLANEINAGALPAHIDIISNETVGPTLGAIDLVKSLYASMGGLAVVLLFMIVVYRLPGFLADVALVIYVVMMLAILSISNATLTLPGIAGFVLSIGMAVDANVLIFERIKEELWNGKTLRAAVSVGFRRAFSAVFDSHFTTIVGAGVLYMLGTGTVKGFAFTLFWGTVLSLLTAVFFTRFFVDVLVENNVATAPELYGVKSDDVGVFAKAGA